MNKKILTTILLTSFLIGCVAEPQTPKDEPVQPRSTLLELAPPKEAVKPKPKVIDETVLVTSIKLVYVKTKFETISGKCHRRNQVGKANELTTFEGKFICGIRMTFVINGYACDIVDDVRSIPAERLRLRVLTHGKYTGLGLEIVDHEGVGYWQWQTLVDGVNKDGTKQCKPVR